LVVDFPGDVAFEAAHDFLGAFAFLTPSGHVDPGSVVVAHPDEHDAVDGLVRLPVPGPAEPVPGCLARGGGDCDQ
jgi:hypothetical protein